MNSTIKKIVEEEPQEVLAGLLLDLVELDSKNEERVLLLYHKQ